MKSHYRNISPKITILCIVVLTPLLFCPAAYAHKASIFAWVQGDTVHTQSKMMGGKRPKQALVEVFDENQTLLLQGRTDAQGQFSFRAPQKSYLKIVLNAGAGHRAVWSLTPHDFTNTVSESGHVHTREDIISAKPSQTSHSNSNNAGVPQNLVTREEIAALIASSLDKKLAPVMAKLAAMDQKRIEPADIIGGLGYILGLVGLAAYMHYRRKSRDKNA